MGITNMDQNVYVLNLSTNQGEMLTFKQGDTFDIFYMDLVRQRMSFIFNNQNYETWIESISFLDLDLFN